MFELFGEAPRSVGEQGAKLGIDMGTITPLLKRLEQADFVIRRRDIEDKRKVFVEVTASGKAAARRCSAFAFEHEK